ncbi:Oligopeptide transport system permease protein OppB (TC 3.A.1.5.1) [plant metagenome]|uniref:Oligopeptide transport system permease protein OppB (TC 3.A.1.5.1) n=2 Tax=root TaxID=1 RepID=A0A1C3JYR1_9BURK|nr:ABC transporter permease [Orrella dioscoreae]SBT24294.1 Oligopeptide transport system permease protein OppB (TC 3.A.1.5.1) [Orrella dioscoreae]SOE49840.1 Oligopeptide transport system permease protein OppB (TC 3.A.1.5.1) [Orrella dioscoreae]
MRVSLSSLRYVLARTAQVLPVAFLVIVLNFILMKTVPGDMADVIAGEAGAATPEFMAQLRAQFGSDQPLPSQFLSYVGKVLTLDLGWSFRHNAPVATLIAERVPATLALMSTALLLSALLGAWLGAVAGVTRWRWLDRLISALGALGFAVPLFWLGLMAIVLFSVTLGWLPSGGMQQLGASHQGWARAWDLARHLALPVLCLTLHYTAVYIRLMRESVRDVSQLDHVRTARAKGASRRRLVWRHIVPNALLPMVTMTGLQFGALLSGSVTVETVFAWPGLGQLALSAVSARDINLLLGILLASALFVVLVNLFTDLLYAVLDPRIDMTGGRA